MMVCRKMTQKIRVGVFSRYYPKYRDGVFALLSRNAELDFTFLAGLPPTKSFIRDTAVRPYNFRFNRWFTIPVPGTPNCISYRCGTIWAMLRRKYDVLILGNDILGLDDWICCLGSRLFHVPVCIWGQGLSRPPSRFRDALRYALTSLATAALYYTDSGKEYWIKRGISGEKLFVAYNALDTDNQIQIRSRTTPEDLAAHLEAKGLAGKKIIAFLGRLIPEKKPRVFIDAVAKAAAQDPDIVGVIIGEGPEQKALEQYVHEKSLTERIRLVGAVYDEPTMAKYLMSSVAMALPAFAGLAIQHAAVYGVPVILGNVAHSHGPEQEIVAEGKTGLWCPDGDVDAFAAAMLRLIREPVFRDSLSANIKRVIDEKYNVASMAQGFIDMVRYCMGKRPLVAGNLKN
jgi:glycosyltransferase involved in cell wall biosynthesis